MVTLTFGGAFTILIVGFILGVAVSIWVAKKLEMAIWHK